MTFGPPSGLRRIRFAALLVCLALPSSMSLAQSSSPRTPQFIDYPAQPMRSGKASLRLSADDLMYRTRYRNIHRGEPNFAGHYGVMVVGCGTDCTFLLVLDYQTGRAVNLGVPQGEALRSCDDHYLDTEGLRVENDYYFQLDSRMMVVGGRTNDNACSARFFVERSGHMELVREISLQASR
jgi:hypothetical protein